MAFHAVAGLVDWVQTGTFALTAGKRASTDWGRRALEGMAWWPSFSFAFSLKAARAFSFSLRAPWSALEARGFVGEVPEPAFHEEVLLHLGCFQVLWLASDVLVELIRCHVSDKLVVVVGVGVVSVLLVVAVVGVAGGTVTVSYTHLTLPTSV